MDKEYESSEMKKKSLFVSVKQQSGYKSSPSTGCVKDPLMLKTAEFPTKFIISPKKQKPQIVQITESTLIENHSGSKSSNAPIAQFIVPPSQRLREREQSLNVQKMTNHRRRQTSLTGEMDKDESTGIVSDFTKTCRNMQQAKCEDMVDLSLHSCERSQTIGKTKTPSGTDNRDDFVDCTKNLVNFSEVSSRMAT